jgi:hypothetical protein
MTDTFGNGAKPQKIAKTKSHARVRAPKSAAIALNAHPHVTADTRTQTERSLPIGWTLLGMGIACAAFWATVVMVVF